MSVADIIQLIMLSAIILQLYLAYKAFKADHERRRKQATFEFINAVSERYRKALNDFDTKHGLGKVVDISDYSGDDYFTVKSYLSEIERICAGVNSEVFDYDILRKMMAGNLITSNDRFRQHINNARITRNNKKLYIEFDKVANKLRADRSKETPYDNIGQMRHD